MGELIRWERLNPAFQRAAGRPTQPAEMMVWVRLQTALATREPCSAAGRGAGAVQPAPPPPGRGRPLLPAGPSHAAGPCRGAVPLLRGPRGQRSAAGPGRASRAAAAASPPRGPGPAPRAGGQRRRRLLGPPPGPRPGSERGRGRGALTVPGRAHQLVQHGAHLGLRRHLERGGGPARPGRLTPTAAYKARGAARPEALPLRVTARARAEPRFPAEGAGGTRRAARSAGAAAEGGAQRSGAERGSLCPAPGSVPPPPLPPPLLPPATRARRR